MTNLAESILRISQYKVRIGNTETKYVDVNKVLSLIYAAENDVPATRNSKVKWRPVKLDPKQFIHIYD